MNKYYYNFLSSSRDKILFLCVIMSVTGISQARIKSNRLFKLSRSRVSQECHFLRFSTRAVMCHRDTVHGRYIAQLLGYPLLTIWGRAATFLLWIKTQVHCEDKDFPTSLKLIPLFYRILPFRPKYSQVVIKLTASSASFNV